MMKTSLGARVIVTCMLLALAGRCDSASAQDRLTQDFMRKCSAQALGARPTPPECYRLSKQLPQAATSAEAYAVRRDAVHQCRERNPIVVGHTAKQLLRSCWGQPYARQSYADEGVREHWAYREPLGFTVAVMEGGIVVGVYEQSR